MHVELTFRYPPLGTPRANMSQAQHGLPHLDPQRLRKKHVQLIPFRAVKQCDKTNCYDQFAFMKLRKFGFRADVEPISFYQRYSASVYPSSWLAIHGLSWARVPVLKGEKIRLS